MEDIFKKVNSFYEQETEIRDKIKEELEPLDSIIREITTHLASIHDIEFKKEDIKPLLEKTNPLFNQCKNVFDKLNKAIPQGMYYKYNNLWSQSLSALTNLAALQYWLEKGELIPKELVEEMAMSKDFILPLEDYLYGICNLFTDLSRLAVNSVTRKEFDGISFFLLPSHIVEPHKIAKFLNQVYSGLRLLNLKNDNLRKRFDGIKYDVKKVEEVIYDMSIRGLNQSKH